MTLTYEVEQTNVAQVALHVYFYYCKLWQISEIRDKSNAKSV